MTIKSTIDGLNFIGARLKNERFRLSWTREKMALYGGVSRASQRIYDSSQRVPPIIYLLRLAEAGADFNYILHGVRNNVNDQLCISEKTISKAFELAWHMWHSEDNNVKTKEDAVELFSGILKELHKANSFGYDVKVLAKATSSDKRTT